MKVVTLGGGPEALPNDTYFLISGDIERGDNRATFYRERARNRNSKTPRNFPPRDPRSRVNITHGPGVFRCLGEGWRNARTSHSSA